MNIQQRLLLLILMAAIPVLAVLVAGEFADRRTDRGRAALQAVQLARTIASEQQGYFENARYVFATLAHLPDLVTGDRDACNRLTSNITTSLPSFTDTAVLSADGMVLCSSDGAAVGTDLSDRDFFRTALATGVIAIGHVTVDPETGKKILPVAYPVIDQRGRTEMVLLLALDLQVLASSITLPPLPPGSDVMLLDGAGTILARQPDPGEWIGQVITDEGLLNALPRAGRTTVAATSVEGRTSLYGVAPLQKYKGLFVTVGIPRASLFAAAERSFDRQMMSIGAIFLGVLIVVLMMSEFTIRRPLKALQRAVADIGAGRLETRAGLNSSVPEFADLGRAVDSMADSLQRHDETMVELNDSLKAALDEKNILFQELHHRVKNNLQMIVSLLSIQAGRNKDPAIQTVLRESLQRIIAMSEIHQILYQSEQLVSLDFSAAVRSLCDQLAVAYARPNGEVKMEVTAEPVELDINSAIPLALLLTELVSNAFKHAFPPGSDGRIAVTLETVDRHVEMTVADNGVGFDGSTGNEAPEGLGLTLIDRLAAQVGGSVARLPGSGTAYRLRLDRSIVDGALPGGREPDPATAEGEPAAHP